MQLQTALEALGQKEEIPVYHFDACGHTGDYILWAEEGQGDAVWADGKMQMQSIRGTVDLFAKSPALFGVVQDALGECGASWYLNSIQYEDDTGLLHYEWVWEIG